MSEKYNTYLKSDWWIQFSTKIKLDTRACERCGVIYKLQVHHVTYKRLGKEKKSDVRVLCSFCHTEFHDKYGVPKNIKKKTDQFIGKEKAKTKKNHDRSEKNQAELDMVRFKSEGMIVSYFLERGISFKDSRLDIKTWKIGKRWIKRSKNLLQSFSSQV